jgi:valyl-tRNA synthetase
MNVKGYDPKERFEFGVITSFAYPIEDSGMSSIIIPGATLMTR